MRGTEKIGRATWITYLITATPISLFCTDLCIISVRFLCIEDFGPIEEPPLPTSVKGIVWISTISLPVVWVLGFTIAHRFNQTASRAVPFLANILPITGLLWFSLTLAREGGEFVWLVGYTGFLLALLGIGMIATLISPHQKLQTPNKARHGRAFSPAVDELDVRHENLPAFHFHSHATLWLRHRALLWNACDRESERDESLWCSRD